MRWKILSQNPKDIINSLLKNRGITNKKNFLDPTFPKKARFDSIESRRAIDRIKKAIKDQENIVVYGDYDADGICATAIMWETLNLMKANVLPFIPQRENEGYGLSIEGIKNIGRCSLLIAVDSGIVAHEAIDYANKQDIDVIVLDHHEKPKILPKAFAIVHTLDLCASGLAYFFARELCHSGLDPESLELAAIATVTDLMPLIGINRSIVKFGLEALNKTSRPGLKALFEVADLTKIGTYEIGYMIGPRLNASGRIESALTALRLLCTHNKEKAIELAQLLNKTNKDRQDLLADQTQHALVTSLPAGKAGHQSLATRIIVIESEIYHQGIIGLIAGKLVEKYYLPAIVISRGETVSKASARSISGFNIIEAIRAQEKLLINAGGHPMAAGFTIETTKIAKFKTQISNLASKKITSKMLEKTLRVDCELNLKDISLDFYQQLQQFAPFGIGNPEPVFASEVTLDSFRTVGSEAKHLKLVVNDIDAIAFNQGSLAAELKVGQTLNLAYSLDLNTFNGKSALQLKVKDIILKDKNSLS